MANIKITDVDTGNVILGNTQFEDGLLTLAGATTVLGGTILARDSVSGKFVPFVTGGETNENGIPKAILTYPVTSTGAGDVPIRAGIEGQYRTERLIIQADGDASNVTKAVTDQLRDYGLTPINVNELGAYDNK